MNQYELVVMVDAQMAGTKKEAVRQQAVDVVSKNGGKITRRCTTRLQA